MGDSFETQEKILGAALKLFAQKGYNGTATIEIAREAGVSEASIFKYYKTKKILLHSVLKKIVSDIIPGLALGAIKVGMEILSTENSRETLKKFLMLNIGKIEENIGAFKVFLNEVQYHDDIKKEYFENFVPRVLGTIEGGIKKAVEQGHFKELNTRTAARSLMSMLAFMIIDAKVLGTPLDFDRELDTILDIYFNGVLAKKEGE